MSAPGFDFRVSLLGPDGVVVPCVVLQAAGWVQAMEWAEAVNPDAMAVGAVCLSRLPVRLPAVGDQKGGA